MRAERPACRCPAVATSCRYSRIRPFFEQMRYCAAIIKPLPVINSPTVDVEKVSHAAAETAPDDIRWYIVTAVAHAQRYTCDRLFRCVQRKENEFDHVTSRAPPGDARQVRVTGERRLEREAFTGRRVPINFLE